MIEMEWRHVVWARETAVEKLLGVCGEYELRRRLGEDGRRLRPLSRRIEGLLRVEGTFSEALIVRPVGEGRALRASDVGKG